MKYNIIEFIETKTVAVVPVSWINNNEVRWNEKLSSSFSKRGLFPKNKWKNYKVKTITSKIFDTYDEAEKRMKKILSINKTDIETDDILSGTDLPKRRRSSSFSSSSDNDCDNPLKSIKPYENVIDSSNVENLINITNVQYSSEVVPASDLAITEETVVISNSSVNNEKETFGKSGNIESEVIEDRETYVLVEQTVLENILTKLNTLEKSMKKVENYIMNNEKIGDDKCNSAKIQCYKSRCAEMLPLKDIDKLTEFEKELSTDSSLITDLEKYLSNQITSKDLRSFVRITVNKMYSMDLQGQINYSGANGKKQLKELLSTETMLRTICQVVPELILMGDENEKIGKAEAELKYQLQHFYDRKRSMERKKNRIMLL